MALIGTRKGLFFLHGDAARRNRHTPDGPVPTGWGVYHAILADQAGGRTRFDVEAETVGDALRALPAADLLLDERGELRPLAWVDVDGTDARDHGGLACPWAIAREVRIVGAVAGG